MFLPVKPHALDCESCSDLLPRHLAGELDGPRMARVREHLAACEGCRGDYVNSAQTLAAIGAQHRHERMQVEAQVDALRRRREAEGPNPFERRSRLRSMLWPALAILLLAMMSRASWSKTPQLVAQKGAVYLDGLALEPQAEAGQLVPGRACWTGPDGAAQMQSPSGRADLMGATTVAYQGSKPLRLRLERGGVRVSGNARVVLAGGLLEVSGGVAEVVLQGSSYRLRGIKGTAFLLSADGSLDLDAGQELLIPAAGAHFAMDGSTPRAR